MMLEVSSLQNTFSINLFQDLDIIDLSEFKYSGTNITAFRILSPDRVGKIMKDWNFTTNMQLAFQKLGLRQNQVCSLYLLSLLKISYICLVVDT